MAVHKATGLVDAAALSYFRKRSRTAFAVSPAGRFARTHMKKKGQALREGGGVLLLQQSPYRA